MEPSVTAEGGRRILVAVDDSDVRHMPPPARSAPPAQAAAGLPPLPNPSPPLANQHQWAFPPLPAHQCRPLTCRSPPRPAPIPARFPPQTSERVVEWALEHLLRPGDAVTLLHVVPQPMPEIIGGFGAMVRTAFLVERPSQQSPAHRAARPKTRPKNQRFRTRS